MKALFLIIVLAVFFFSNLFGQTKSPFSVYQHKLFSLSYPTSWDTTKQDKSMIFTAVEKNKKDKDPFNENFSIYIVGLDKTMSLKKLIESVYTEFKQKGGSDKDILEKGILKTEKGLSYALFKTKTLANDRTIISSAVYFIKAKKVFVLTLSHDMIESAYYDKLYKSVINTFEIK